MCMYVVMVYVHCILTCMYIEVYMYIECIWIVPLLGVQLYIRVLKLLRLHTD